MIQTKNESTTKAQQRKNLIAKVNEGREALSKADQDDMKARYKVGGIVREVMDEAKYGTNAVAVMEKELKRDAKTLYRYVQVVKLWPTSEFNALVRRRDEAKLPITWSHLEALVDVEDGRTRQGLLSKVFKKCLSVRALKALIEEKKPAKSPSKTAAPLVAIGRLTRSLDPIEEKVRALETKALPMLMAKSKELTPKERAELHESWQRLEAAQQMLAEFVAKVAEVLDPSDNKAMGGRVVEAGPTPSEPPRPETVSA